MIPADSGLWFGDRSGGAARAPEDGEEPRCLLRGEGSQPEKVTHCVSQLRASEEGKTREAVKGSVAARGGVEGRGVNGKNTENF